MAPLPDVAGDVVHPEAVRREGVDRRGRDVPVGTGVRVGEPALEHVHAVLATRFEVVTPGEGGTDATAACGAFPFGFRRKPCARPAAVRDRVVPRRVHDRMIAAAVDPAAGTFGVPPVGAFDLAPPLRARHRPRVGEVVGEESGEHERPSEALGIGLPTGRIDETREAIVGHGKAIDEERVERDVVDRTLAIAGVRPHRVITHAERTGRDVDHRVGMRSASHGHRLEVTR